MGNAAARELQDNQMLKRKRRRSCQSNKLPSCEHSYNNPRWKSMSSQHCRRNDCESQAGHWNIRERACFRPLSLVGLCCVGSSVAAVHTARPLSSCGTFPTGETVQPVARRASLYLYCFFDLPPKQAHGRSIIGTCIHVHRWLRVRCAPAHKHMREACDAPTYRDYLESRSR